MESASPSWIDGAATRLRDIAARPVLLFVVLVTANALARPYANLAHDARLYSVQVLNQIEQGYGDDLFLRYGSQDQYSLFSRCVAPLASAFGIEVTFFVLYLLSNGLLILALQRLVTKLIPDSALATLALLFMMVTPLPFGGFNIFMVQEQFLTPRILANAFVLFGLERILARSFFTSLMLMLGAAVMHPLMAQGGLAIWFVVVAWDRLPRAFFYGLGMAGAALAAVILLYEPLGLLLFGSMDAEWRAIVRAASAYNFPGEWQSRDWFGAASSVLVALGSAWALRREDCDKTRFLAIAAFVSVAGLLGTAIASTSPYALLFQAQPYRIMWILAALQAPLGFWLACRLWRQKSPSFRLIAALLFAPIWFSGAQTLEICFPLLFLPILIVRFRGLDSKPRRADWAATSLVVSLILGCVGWSLYKNGVILANIEDLRDLLDPLEIARLFVDNLGSMVWILLIAVVAQFLVVGRSPLRVAGALALALAVQTTYFVVPDLRVYQDHATLYAADLRKMAGFLENSRPTQRSRPTIYCALGRIDYVWVDLRAKSYFDRAQIVGCLFNRETAEEGRRRAVVVRAFEIDRFQEGLQFLPVARRRSIETLYQADLETTAPTRADLEKLCLNEDLDYVVLKQEYPGLATKSFGRLHLYDCRQVRLALQGPAASMVAGAFVRESSPKISPVHLVREVTSP